MIRINLLKSPTAATSAQAMAGISILSAPEDQKRQGVAKLMVLFLPVIFLNIYYSQFVSDRYRKQIVQAKKSLSEYQQLNTQQDVLGDEIRRVRGEIKVFQEQINIIEGLSKNRSEPIMALDQFHFLVPEKVWLNRIQFRGNLVSLAGFSITDYEVSRFMQGLQDSRFFEQVNGGVSQAKTESGPLKTFEIQCLLGRQQ